MLLFSRHVSALNISHPHGYLRNVVAKQLASVNRLTPSVLKTDLRDSQLL